MKSRYVRREQKHGIEMLKTIERALQIDEETGTTFWRDAIRKEMANNAKAFKILAPDASTPVGHTFIKCHMVFDIKQGTLQRKARFVGQRKHDRGTSIYHLCQRGQPRVSANCFPNRSTERLGH